MRGGLVRDGNKSASRNRRNHTSARLGGGVVPQQAEPTPRSERHVHLIGLTATNEEQGPGYLHAGASWGMSGGMRTHHRLFWPS